MKKTKIVCTIGPSSETYDIVAQMARNGMNVARLNFSHGSYDEQYNRVKLIREVEQKEGLTISILLDTKGPEIRLGTFKNNREDYKIGEIVEIVKQECIGEHNRFWIQVPELFNDVKEGNYILVNDGKMKLTILENDGEVIKARVDVNGYLSSKKGCNVPNVKLSMPFLSEKDIEDIKFACKHKLHFIAASFVRRQEDVLAIKKILIEEGQPKINIIAKIENQEGFDNLESILEVADGVMVARGDLGVEVDTEFVPIYQKKIIEMANKMGKFVITATHMLDSMTYNPRCTRAEASDVANAVFDGTDAVMLSSESAAGDYPCESVATMAKICKAAEAILNHKERLNILKKSAKATIQDAISIAISEATQTLDIAAIVVFTLGGTTARKISKYRPEVPVYAVTFKDEVAHRLNLFWGVTPVVSKIENNLTNDDFLASDIAKMFGIKPGQLIIISAGYPTGEGSANMMKIVSVK